MSPASPSPPRLRWAARARTEVDRAIDWYLAKDIHLAEAFGAEIQDILDALREAPRRWPIWRPPALRRYVFQHFPYNLYYRVDGDGQHIKIVAFMHQRQDSARRLPSAP